MVIFLHNSPWAVTKKPAALRPFGHLRKPRSAEICPRSDGFFSEAESMGIKHSWLGGWHSQYIWKNMETIWKQYGKIWKNISHVPNHQPDRVSVWVCYSQTNSFLVAKHHSRDCECVKHVKLRSKRGVEWRGCEFWDIPLRCGYVWKWGIPPMK